MITEKEQTEREEFCLSDFTTYNRCRRLAIVIDQIMQEANKTKLAKKQMERRKKQDDKRLKEIVADAN